MKITFLGICLSLLFYFCPFLNHAQKHEWGVMAGSSNYLGEIGGKEKNRRDFVFDLQLVKTRPSGGIYYRAKVSSFLKLKTEFNYVRITGDDKLSLNLSRRARNLNFINSIFELNQQAECRIWENSNLSKSSPIRKGVAIVAGLGIGVFYHNPKALVGGAKIPLRPLRTEGRYYLPISICVPISGACYFTINRQHVIGLQINWRTTFTDYLDDISTQYPNGGSALSNRTHELNPGDFPEGFFAYYQPGAKRGDPSHRDSYFTVQLSYGILISKTSPFLKQRYMPYFRKRKSFGHNGKERTRK